MHAGCSHCVLSIINSMHVFVFNIVYHVDILFSSDSSDSHGTKRSISPTTCHTSSKRRKLPQQSNNPICLSFFSFSLSPFHLCSSFLSYIPIFFPFVFSLSISPSVACILLFSVLPCIPYPFFPLVLPSSFPSVFISFVFLFLHSFLMSYFLTPFLFPYCPAILPAK